MDTEQSAPEAVRRLPRFTLRTVFVTSAFVCLLIWHWVTVRELARVRAENLDVRNQAGLLTVTDPNRVHVMAIPTVEDRTWRWRVYVPQSGIFRLCSRFTELPESGVPKPRHQFQLQPGHHIITAMIQLDGDKPVLRLGEDFLKSTLTLSEPIKQLFSQDTGVAWAQAGQRATHVTKRGDPIVLLHVRKTISNGGRVTIDMNPTDGLMVWIE